MVEITPAEIERQLGVRIPLDEIVRILQALEFGCEVSGDHADPHAVIRATAPDHRLDIGTGVVGRADIVEEMARVYGYARIPETLLAEVLPPPHPNRDLDLEERVRDVLVSLGLQEVVTYSLTSPEREARLRRAGRRRRRDALRPPRQPHRRRSRRDAAHAARRPHRGGGREQPAHRPPGVLRGRQRVPAEGRRGRCPTSRGGWRC